MPEIVISRLTYVHYAVPSTTMTVSNHTASLSRYRPVVLTLTGALVAYGIYNLYTTWRNGQQASLRRRDAVRRSRPPSSLARLRRDLVEESGEMGPQHDTQSNHGNQGTLYSHRGNNILENELSQEIGSLGIIIIRGNSGEDILVTLKLDTLPTVQELCDDYGLPNMAAENARKYIESFFVSRYLDRLFLQREILQLSTQEKDLLVEWFNLRGLQSDSVRQAVDNFGSSRHPSLQGTNTRAFVEREDTTTNTSRAHSPTIQDNGIRYNSTGSLRRARSLQIEINDREDRGNNLKSMLYYIAEEQAKQDGYVHRGVSCDSCDIKPIRGVRWRCANCPDYDLCSDCEAVNDHPVTHIFYKVKIPAHFLGNPEQAQPIIYPGNPELLPDRLPSKIRKRLVAETRYEAAEIEALWEQFRCLANSSWIDDPNHLGAAIDRDAFHRSFAPYSRANRPAPNPIYDRIFAFYDSNRDNLIGFEEFMKGLSNLHSNNREAKLRQVFDWYDLDQDGYVARKDFLRMFRAYYAIQKDITRDLIAVQEEQLASNGALAVIQSGQPLSAAFNDLIPVTERRVPGGKPFDNYGDAQVSGMDAVLESSDDTGDRRDIIGGAIPRFLRNHRDASDYLSDSSESSGEMPLRVRPRALERDISQLIDDNQQIENEIIDPELSRDQEAERPEVSNFGANLSQPSFGSGSNNRVSNSTSTSTDTFHLDVSSQNYQPERDETALWERWRRRQFYVDEEEGLEPPEEPRKLDQTRDGVSGSSMQRQNEEKIFDSHITNMNTNYPQGEVSGENAIKGCQKKSGICIKDNSDDLTAPTISKVASGSDENVNIKSQSALSQGLSQRSRSSSKVRFEDDPDIENRSNASTSSRPVGERWGGFEIPEAEFDIGHEILYQVTQQALNEILDPLFREKEDIAMQVWETKALRKQLSHTLNVYCKNKNIDESMDTRLTRQRLFGVGAKDDDKGSDVLLSNVPEPSISIRTPLNNHSAGDAGLQDYHVEPLQTTDGAIARSINQPNTNPSSTELFVSGNNDFTTSVLDLSILSMPLDQLLKSAGYTAKGDDPEDMPLINMYSETPVLERIIPDLSDEENVFSEPYNQPSNFESSYLVKLSRDQTFPQNRPNSTYEFDLAQKLLYASLNKKAENTANLGLDTEKGTTGLDRDRNLGEKPLPDQGSYENGLSAPASDHSQPSEALLARLTLLNAEDREIKQRKGAGRISFEEFITVLQNDHRGDLAFVEGWLEMASF